MLAAGFEPGPLDQESERLPLDSETSKTRKTLKTFGGVETPKTRKTLETRKTRKALKTFGGAETRKT